MIRSLLLALALATLWACGDLSDYPQAACSSRGELGCECGAKDTCKRGPDGMRLACTEGLCQVATCSPDQPGEAGCACEGDKACSEGHLCLGGRCEVDTGQSLRPPADPLCYTPCREDLVQADGSIVTCSKDGLLPGCIGGALCRNGTCVVPAGSSQPAGDRTSFGLDSEPGSCEVDAQCPDFQACIDGACYSDCSTDSECRGDRRCYRHACRLPCDTANDTCPVETVCTTLDGEAGFCLPLAAADKGAARPAVSGSFSLSTTSIDFATGTEEKSFRISNDTPRYTEFVVRKIKHREFSDQGPKSFTENALFWLELSAGQDAPARVQELTVGVGPGESKEIRIGNPDNPDLDRWDGTIQVSQEELGIRELSLSYARSPEGQWAGVMYYVANFPDDGLDAWVRNRSDRNALRAVGNAFIRRWGALRDNRISLREFNAALIAMQTESWKWDSVKQRCPNESNPDPTIGCYLYENNDGIAVFSDSLAATPIPTGVAELPIVMNVRGASASPLDWAGKIVSSEALHYAGNPRVELAFASDPNRCAGSQGGSCLTYLDDFKAEVLVGGRYATDALDRGCSLAAPGTFKQVKTPWLIPGFEGDTTLDEVTGRRYRYDCRDTLLPFGPDNKDLNVSMAASNPIPDGATRRRNLELIDGAMIDQSSMLIIFRERLPSFLDPADTEGFSSYGYIVLQRAKANLVAKDFEGNANKDYRPVPELPGLSCSPALVRQVLGPLGESTLNGLTASAMGIGVVEGFIPTDDAIVPIGPGSQEKVHYYCAETGFFDGGPNDHDGEKAEKIPCPPESRVEYFTLQGEQGQQARIAGLACQTKAGICRAGEQCERMGCAAGQSCPSKGSCGEVLETWKANGTHQIHADPVFRCESSDAVICSNDRSDLREGKLFYPNEIGAAAIFRSLDDEVDEAFRYKTRFRNRVGTSVGFAPQVCIGDSVPYCYDPEAIEGIRDRVDCATHVYATYYNDLSADARSTLKEFLVRNFSYSEEIVPGLATPYVIDGFERLNAELLIMMGDESFTSAFASRFDLAGQKLANFEGDLFEPNGISLSGGAGFQMYSLYQAAQYYEMALDRFYGQSSVIWTSMEELPAGQGFITLETTVSYFDRLIRASAQKTRVWSEVAKLYLGFNRPDLARLVVERAYTQAYMESTILSQMMRKVSRTSDATATAQITKAVELAQYTYRAALLDMRTVYRDISDETTFYGIPPDYIPFPALDPGDTNAFVKVMKRAREMARVAAEKEQRALDDARSFDTDSALFQAELGRIRDEAEDGLAQICGTFTVMEEGSLSVYPAIPKYAHLSEKTRTFGDPCGLVGNGELYDAIMGLEQAQLEFQGLKLAHRNLLASAADAEEQAERQCARITSFADYIAEKDGEILRYQDGINSLQLIIDTTSNLLDLAGTAAGLTKCAVGTSTDCPTAALSLGAYLGVSIAGNALMAVNGAIIVGLERRIGDLENMKVQREIKEECDAAKIDTEYVVKDLMRQSLELELEIAKFQYDLKLAFSQIEKLRNDASSAMAGQAENEEMAINIEAARNDPNVRIYRNDAITAADRTFLAALRETYRATKVYEYYTSQSYAAADKLFLVRMVANGDITLEAYLDELDQAFVQFQEGYGNPDTRVAILSLRDDILRIPRLGDDGVALSEAARTALLRTKLRDVNLLDNRGYLSMAFSTSFDELSPLTRNHKVRLIEAEIVGDNVGDSLGRVYVTQRGTGVVRAVDSSTNYYSFPTRTAVLNPFFNGSRPLAPDVYRSERLRDRPYISTGWDLVFNQKDEKVNEDINLASLTDIRLYVYYTDFTEL